MADVSLTRRVALLGAVASVGFMGHDLAFAQASAGSLPLVVGVVFVTFMLVRIGGGDPVALLAGPTASGVMASKRGRPEKSSRGLSWAVSVRSFMSSQMGDGG